MAVWPSRSPNRVSWSIAIVTTPFVLPTTALGFQPPLLAPPEQLVPESSQVTIDQLGGQAQPLVSAPRLSATPIPPDQLTQADADKNQDLPQLHDPERSVGKLQALSNSQQSAPQPAQALDGKDRCEPRARPKDQPEICKHVVETRAEEFARPAQDAPVSSPEKRLLGSRTAPSGDAVARDALKRTPGEAETADDSTTQAIASIVLAPPAPAPSETPPPDDPGGIEKFPGMNDPSLLGAILPPPGQP